MQCAQSILNGAYSDVEYSWRDDGLAVTKRHIFFFPETFLWLSAEWTKASEQLSLEEEANIFYWCNVRLKMYYHFYVQSINQIKLQKIISAFYLIIGRDLISRIILRKQERVIKTIFCGLQPHCWNLLHISVNYAFQIKRLIQIKMK